MMKINRFAAMLLVMLVACKPGDNNTDDPGKGGGDDNGSQISVEVPDFARGADVSWVSEMEHDGRSFKKADGTPADIFEVLKDCGINSVRLRVWVDPAGGWSGKDDVVKLASRASNAGMALMIDFHYSDFFADPGRQTFPAAWSADISDVSKTATRVKEHTTDILNALKEEGVAPAWIQIGNETRSGFLWPLGRLWDDKGDISGGWERFVQLYNAGYSAAKALFPQAVVMPHIDNAYADNAWWFTKFKGLGAKFDGIALSHYPQTASGMTAEAANSAALARIRALAVQFNMPVYVAEVGVQVGSVSTSAALLKSFMDGVKAIPACKGIFYWEPEMDGSWKPAVYSSLGWGAYGMGAFTTDGRPTAIMDIFKN